MKQAFDPTAPDLAHAATRALAIALPPPEVFAASPSRETPHIVRGGPADQIAGTLDMTFEGTAERPWPQGTRERGRVPCPLTAPNEEI